MAREKKEGGGADGASLLAHSCDACQWSGCGPVASASVLAGSTTTTTWCVVALVRRHPPLCPVKCGPSAVQCPLTRTPPITLSRYSFSSSSSVTRGFPTYPLPFFHTLSLLPRQPFPPTPSPPLPSFPLHSCPPRRISKPATVYFESDQSRAYTPFDDPLAIRVLRASPSTASSRIAAA